MRALTHLLALYAALAPSLGLGEGGYPPIWQSELEPGHRAPDCLSGCPPASYERPRTDPPPPGHVWGDVSVYVEEFKPDGRRWDAGGKGEGTSPFDNRTGHPVSAPDIMICVRGGLGARQCTPGWGDRRAWCMNDFRCLFPNVALRPGETLTVEIQDKDALSGLFGRFSMDEIARGTCTVPAAPLPPGVPITAENTPGCFIGAAGVFIRLHPVQRPAPPGGGGIPSIDSRSAAPSGGLIWADDGPTAAAGWGPEGFSYPASKWALDDACRGLLGGTTVGRFLGAKGLGWDVVNDMVQDAVPKFAAEELLRARDPRTRLEAWLTYDPSANDFARSGAPRGDRSFPTLRMEGFGLDLLDWAFKLHDMFVDYPSFGEKRLPFDHDPASWTPQMWDALDRSIDRIEDPALRRMAQGCHGPQP